MPAPTPRESNSEPLIAATTQTLIAGAVAACLAAVMPTAVLPSTEARGYSLMVLCSALMTTAMLRLLRAPGRGAFVLYAVACGLGTWSHLVTVCVPAFHGMWCAWTLLRTRRDDAARVIQEILQRTDVPL